MYDKYESISQLTKLTCDNLILSQVNYKKDFLRS